MTIRFLQTVDSGVPGVPFAAGQVIQVESPSPQLLSYLDGVRAEVVRDTPQPEFAVTRSPRGRKGSHARADRSSGQSVVNR